MKTAMWTLVLTLAIVGMVAAQERTAVATPGEDGAVAEKAPAAEVAKPDAEKPAVEEAEPLDVAKLTVLLKDYEAALYATEQQLLADKIERMAKPHADELIGKMGEPAKPDLEVVRLVGFTKSDKAAEKLLPLIDSADQDTRSAAVFALGTLGDPKAVPRLMTLLDDANAKVGVQSALALGRIGDKTAYDALAARIASKDIVKRLAAIKGLGLLGDKRAQALLEKRLAETDDPLEMTAALDALNLIAGDDLYRILTQLEKIAGALEKHGTGRQTQLAQAAITDALSRFIKAQEDKQQQGQGQGQGQQKRQTSQQGQGQGQQSGSASGPPKQGGSQPAQNSNAGDMSASDPELKNIERIAGVVWGSLPPAVQEEITAARKQQMPERYQHLLRVYYKILAEGK